MFEVYIKFKLKITTLLMAYDLLNRYYLNIYKANPTTMQGYAVASLYLTSLWGEYYTLKSSDLVYITDNTYTENEIREFAYEILNDLEGLIWIPGLENFEKIFLDGQRNPKKFKQHLNSINFDLAKLD
jgi:hypothetical protein